MAERTSWLEAIETHADEVGAYTLKYIQDESRADWHVLLPLGPEAVALDLGSGWGNIALSVAQRCGRVYCGDVNLINLRLLRARMADREIHNVVPFQYDPYEFLRLPFPDSSVDVVLLNGVLEWIGAVDNDASPARMQLEALIEIRRVLKTGGALYIGIENRCAVSAFRGFGPHGELPYVGLLPRWLSNAITQIVRHKPHRTYIYSLGGYRRLLRKAGFSSPEFFWPYPNYHHPHYLIPLRPRWVKRFWLNELSTSRSSKYRIARSMGLSRLPFHWFASSYGIRSVK